MPGAEISEAVAAYGQHVAATYHQTPQRTDRGLFLMTAGHQAKGKEFDADVVVPLDARRWPETTSIDACCTSRSHGPPEAGRSLPLPLTRPRCSRSYPERRHVDRRANDSAPSTPGRGAREPW